LELFNWNINSKEREEEAVPNPFVMFY